MVKVSNLTEVMKPIVEKEAALMADLDELITDLRHNTTALFRQFPEFDRLLVRMENVLPNTADPDFEKLPLCIRQLRYYKIGVEALRSEIHQRVQKVLDEALTFDQQLNGTIERLEELSGPLLPNGMPARWKVLSGEKNPLERLESEIRGRISWLRGLSSLLKQAHKEGHLVGSLLPPAALLMEDCHDRMTEVVQIIRLAKYQLKIMVSDLVNAFKVLTKIDY